MIQVEDYAKRKGFSVEETERWCVLAGHCVGWVKPHKRRTQQIKTAPIPFLLRKFKLHA